VLAGDSLRAAPAGVLPWAGQRALARALGVGEGWASGRTSAQGTADRSARYGTWLPSGAPEGSDLLWVGMPLYVRESADGEALPESDAWVQRVLQRQGVPRPKRRSA
jgi:hypothetical protein